MFDFIVGINEGSSLRCQLSPCFDQPTSVAVVWWDWGQCGACGSLRGAPGWRLLVFAVHVVCAQPAACCKCRGKSNSSPYIFFREKARRQNTTSKRVFCSCSVNADGCSWFGLAQRCEPQALLLNPTSAYRRSEQLPWDTEEGIVSARGNKALR